MAKQTLNIGTTANDGTGDTLRDAMVKANANFTELYDEQNHTPIGGYHYFALSPTADTINDWRQWGDADGFYTEQCTVANAVKGSGTWVLKFTIQV